MDPEWDGAHRADLDEVVALDVVHLDVSVKAARELGRHQRLELVVSRTPRQAARDEQRLVARRDAEALELRHRRRDRGLSRVAFRSGKRQLRRLHDDRRARAACP